MGHNEEKDSSPVTAAQDAAGTDRRKFLAVAAKFSAVAAALGLGGKTVFGNPHGASGEDLTINLLQQAIQTGDMEGAIKSFRTEINLSDSHFKALRSLTAQDLSDLRRIQGKLANAGGKFGLIWKKI